MASVLSRRTLLKYTRNSLYALPFGSAFLSAIGNTAYAMPTDEQAYTWQHVVTGGGGGFIVNVLFNPTQKDLIYVRTDIGGAYRWEPATETWTQLLAWVSPDEWNLSGVESLATDPVQPERLYIAAGTYTNAWATTNGAILRSDDYGRTFHITPMPFKMGGNMPGRGMSERLAIDPNRNNILYFGARSGNGLWRSNDYGITWNRVASFPDTGPFAENPADTSGYSSDPVGIVWVTFDPATGKRGGPTRTIYVGVAENRPGMNNIYRSTDGGQTWAPLPDQPVSTVSGTTVTMTGGATWDLGSNATTGFLPHQGKLDSQGTLYVTYSDWEGPYNGGHGDVWKFVPASGTWTLISPVPGSDSSNDYFGYGGLGVDMQHPGTLVVASVNSWWPDAQVYRTTDGGTTWKPIWSWGAYPDRDLYYTIDASNAPWLDFGTPDPAPPSPAIKVGWMMEGLNIDPFNSNRMMYGTGATLFATNNLTAWDTGGLVALKSTALGIEETAVNDLISPPANAHLYSALADIAGFRHDDLTKSPPEMYTIQGANVALDYAALKPNVLVRVGSGNSAFSVDGGATWTAGANSIPGASSGGKVAVAADGSRVVWAPGNAPVSYSTDSGTTWIASANIPQGAVVAADRVNPGAFYGFGNGQFWVSSDGGASFAASSATGLPITGDPVVVRAVPGVKSDIWIASGSSATGHVAGIWHSTNGGTTFTRLRNITQAEVIGFGMAASGKSYVTIYTSAIINGTRGIYRSTDGGKSWIRINDDQHQYATNSTITGDPRIYGRVYLGTNGFGMVYGDLAQHH